MSKRSKSRSAPQKSRKRRRSSTPQEPSSLRKRTRLRWFVVLPAVVGIAAVVYVAWPRWSGDELNVVVVTLDTTRADRLGCYGYEGAETPVLDALASQGIRFTDAVATVPMTLPAHASIFTGLDPPHHGVRNNGEYRLDASQVTLAEILQERGYDTAAFVSAFVLNARFGTDQGFAHYDDTVDRAHGHVGTYTSERIARKVTNAALRWLRGRSSSRPFFMWVHYFDPHNDYRPQPPFAERFKSNPYDGEIAYMDSHLGRLVRALNQEGLRDKTLMLVVGDHGESLGEHHERTHSRTIYEAAQHVPLILWCPRLIPEPSVVDDVVVSICDVFPTVMDMLGITYDGPCDGVSLLHSREHPNRMVYMETMATYLENRWAPLHGLRRHGDKYIFAPTPEYYDLKTDPDELTNLLDGTLSEEAKAAVASLSAELAARMQDSPTAEAVAAAAVEVDPEALRRLQSLGYLTGEASQDADELPDPKLMMPAWELLVKAKELRTSGHPERALATIEEVLEGSPNDPAALRELGTVYLDQNRFEEAEQAFRKYIDIKPNVSVYQLLGQLATRAKRYDEAEVFLQEALSLDPQHGRTLISLGYLEDVHGRQDEALRYYELAKRVDPVRTTAAADKHIADVRKRLNTP